MNILIARKSQIWLDIFLEIYKSNAKHKKIYEVDYLSLYDKIHHNFIDRICSNGRNYIIHVQYNITQEQHKL